MSASATRTSVWGRGRYLLRVAIFGVLFLVLLEVSLRVVGVLDFPLYLKDEQLGYIQQPSQSGRFLRRFEWRINSLQMFGEEFRPERHPSLLLIGDSLVWGGNNYLRDDRLGRILERTLGGASVWAVGAGSWSSWSEVEYMRRHPEAVRSCDDLVWILNSGDLDGRTRWSSELTHPTRRPLWATGYLVRKFVISRFFAPETSWDGTLSLRDDAFENMRAHLLSILPTKRRIVVLCYPTRAELDGTSDEGRFYTRFVQRLGTLRQERLEVCDLRDDARWNRDDYRDEMHPNAQGNTELARFVSATLHCGAQAQDSLGNKAP